MMRFNFLFLLLIIFSINGCDDQDKENLVEITPPQENHPATANLNFNSDTITVFRDTKFNFNLDLFGLDMKIASFKIEDQRFDFFYPNGDFTIYPAYFEPGFHKLTLEIISNSGTGSISDLLGYEGYKYEKSWVLLIDGSEAPTLTPISGLSERGYLKFTWDKCNQYNFSYYLISGESDYNYYTKKIYDADSTFFIDSTFFGDGRASFRVFVGVKSSDFYSMGPTVYVIDTLSNIQFKNYGLDSVQVFWKKSKYNVKYKLQVDYLNPSTVLESTDTSCYIAQPNFGLRSRYNLYIYPNNSIGENIINKKYVFGYHYVGESIDGGSCGLGYNFIDHVVYAHDYDNINCYDVDNLSKKSTRNISYSQTGCIASALNSTMVAIESFDFIHFFDNSNFLNPFSLSYFEGAYSTDHFYLTNNGLLAVAYNHKYEQISVAEKKVVTSISITDYPYYSPWACFSTSIDGKYASVVTANGIKIFQIDAGLVTTVYSDSRSYRSVLFNIFNPNQILLTYNDSKSLEIRNVPDFSLVKSIELPTKQVISNINPDNGMLLLSDYKNLYVVDLENTRVVFSIKSGTYDWMPRYYGKRLFSKTGCTIDISNLLTK